MDTQNVTRGQIVWRRRLDWGLSTGTLNLEQFGSSKMLHAVPTAAVVRLARKPSVCDDCRARIQKGEICASSEFGGVHWCAACVTVRKPLMAVAFPGTPRELLDNTVVPDYVGPATDMNVKGW